jgi:hypothetical protein
MSLFSLDTQQSSMFNNDNIECSKCTSQECKYLRCNCCNDVITLNDFLLHINKILEPNSIKLVKLSGVICIKVKVINIYNILKYFKTSDTHTLAVNFLYKVNYNETTTSNGKQIKNIRNIEFQELQPTFIQQAVGIEYLLRCSNIDNMAEVLINIDNLNVLTSQSLNKSTK